MDQHCLVDNQESVVELVRGLDRERVAVLGVEGGPPHLDVTFCDIKFSPVSTAK